MHLIRHDDNTSYETKTRYRRCIPASDHDGQINLIRFIRCTVREDGSLFFIVEVVIVKRKHGACVKKLEHEEELYEREFMCFMFKK